MGYTVSIAFKVELHSADDVELVIKDLDQRLKKEGLEWIIRFDNGDFNHSVIDYEKSEEKDESVIWLTFFNTHWRDDDRTRIIEKWFDDMSFLADELLEDRKNDDPLFGKIVSTQRIRFGEDLEDNSLEEHGYVMNYMYIHREIEL